MRALGLRGEGRRDSVRAPTDVQKSAHYRHHRPRWVVLVRAFARPGVRSPRHGAPRRARSPRTSALPPAPHPRPHHPSPGFARELRERLFDHRQGEADRVLPPRRGFEFVTHKITSTVARIKAGREKTLALGNLEPRRDWGFAGDYVKAIKLVMEQNEPEDFVIATGETHSVKEFAELAFARAGLDWREHVVIDKRFYRPAEVALLQGDSSKARKKLGW